MSVSLTFEFNAVGEIVQVFTPDRYREVDGSYVKTPWLGTFRNYAFRELARIPLEGEVAWILPEGKFTYWQGRITTVSYAPSGNATTRFSE